MRSRYLDIHSWECTPGEDANKHALTNAAAGALSVRRMVFMQARLYWIERCWQDAKNEMWLADY